MGALGEEGEGEGEGRLVLTCVGACRDRVSLLVESMSMGAVSSNSATRSASYSHTQTQPQEQEQEQGVRTRAHRLQTKRDRPTRGVCGVPTFLRRLFFFLSFLGLKSLAASWALMYSLATSSGSVLCRLSTWGMGGVEGVRT